VHTICLSDDKFEQYHQLFSSGFRNASDMHTQFASAFGDSYNYQDPAMVHVTEQAHTSTLSGPNEEQMALRRDICSGEALASAMDLDQIVSMLPTHTPLLIIGGD